MLQEPCILKHDIYNQMLIRWI